MRNPGAPEELEHRRFLAVRRILEGYSTEEVAEFLDVDPRSVRRWFARFRQSGEEGLRAGPVSGRPPRISPTQEKIALRWLSEKPTEHGFDTELWTGPRLAQLIRQEFGIRLNARYLCSWLRARGFTPQKPQRVARQHDPEVIAEWLRTEWPRIKKKARRQGAYLALIDESGLMMAPLVRRTWSLRGQTPKLIQDGGRRQKVSVAAAVWLTPRRDRLALFSRTLINDYFDPWYSAAFLEALLRALGGRVVVVWDGGSMHKGDPIAQLQDAMSDRLSLEGFPPYSPELCPVEPVWSWLKYSRLCNYTPRDASALDGRVVAELSAIQDDQELLRGFFHASELPLPRTLLS